MNILIDLRWMVLGRAGGLEQMAFELVTALPSALGEDKVYLYCPERVYADCVFGKGIAVELIDCERFALVPERVGFDRSIEGRDRTLSRLGIAPRDGSRSGTRVIDVDVVHSIGGYVNDELLDYRNVLTVHDLQHIHFPEYFDEAEIVTRNARYLTSINASQAVICVSEFVKCDLCEQYRLDPGKVHAIWNIPSGSPSKRLSQSKVKKTLSRLGLDSDFLFFPSHGWPHKNHETLVEAFKLVHEAVPDLKLILTGGKFGTSHPAARKVRSLGLEEAVLHIGYRTPTEVQCLYQGAKALVYPSLFEGFGMPVAEAIEAGTPVVCSGIAPLTEIGGEAILTFEPKNPSDIADKLLTVLRDDGVREKLRAKGEVQQKRFSARGIAQKTYNVYRECCGLDPVAAGRSEELENRCESARHWGRVAERNFRRGRSLKGLAALLVTAWRSPYLAKAIWKAVQKDRSPDDEPFTGRHGDGWIGPRFEDWLMVPKGVTQLRLKFEGPPEPFRKGSAFRFHFEGKSVFEGSFATSDSLEVSIGIPRDCTEIVRIGADCERFFVPAELGESEDTRQLSAKLTEIRWVH